MTDDAESIVSTYMAAAIEHNHATSVGDHKAADRAHDIIATMYSQLRRQGHAGQAELVPLLAHENVGVRTWAASHALEFAPRLGEPVLESLAAEPGFAGFTAGMVLSEWRAGRLTFPDV